ncbi:adenylate kinase [Candidatus Dependentiae bacterium]|nr:adenylate kinase [Candidatus Dependentiae bacterium]
MRRIIIVGPNGAGKTTLAQLLSKKLLLPHVELDQLWWMPGWEKRPAVEFAEVVKREFSSGEWVMCGNYAFIRDLLWSNADTIIWLDYPFLLSFCRCLRRTIQRIIRKRECCNGNYETFRKVFLSRESVLIWMIKNYFIRKRTYPSLMSKESYPHLKFIRLRSPRQTRLWLDELSLKTDTNRRCSGCVTTLI